MLTEFWKGLSGELGKRWTAATFYPAFSFWAGGLTLVETGNGRGMSDLELIGRALRMLPELGQAAVLVGVLLGITASGVFIESLTFPVLRLLEGYWPWWMDWLRYRVIDWRARWRWRRRFGTGKRARYKDLALQHRGDSPLSSFELEEYGRLDEFERTLPSYSMPTRLGELLRSAEERPVARYGLDPVICWAQLWLVLAPESRRELEAARTGLDLAVLLWIWSVLFVVWTPGARLAALIGFALAWYAHRQIRVAAVNYGDLIAAAFDLNRFHLYEALHWPAPTDTGRELISGGRITEFLKRRSQVALPLADAPRPGRLESLLGRLPLRRTRRA